jgi:hypothetical protein
MSRFPDAQRLLRRRWDDANAVAQEVYQVLDGPRGEPAERDDASARRLIAAQAQANEIRETIERAEDDANRATQQQRNVQIDRSQSLNISNSVGFPDVSWGGTGSAAPAAAAPWDPPAPSRLEDAGGLQAKISIPSQSREPALPVFTLPDRRATVPKAPEALRQLEFRPGVPEGQAPRSPSAGAGRPRGSTGKAREFDGEMFGQGLSRARQAVHTMDTESLKIPGGGGDGDVLLFGKVVEKVGPRVFKVDLHDDPDQGATDQVSVRILQLDPGEDIPKDTWICPIARRGEGTTRNPYRYYAQIPVFL